MKIMRKLLPVLLVLLSRSPQGLAAESSAKRGGEDPKALAAQQPTIGADGTVRIPDLAVPLSPHMSEEAKQHFIKQFMEMQQWWVTKKPSSTENPPAKDDNANDSRCPGRESSDKWSQALIDRARAVYPVDIKDQKIAGVRTDVITPQGGVSARNRHRVLISVHGGGYHCSTGGGLLGQAEAIPIAGAGKFKVIAIDYRTSPEYKFPAANEDVAAVYRELLKTYKPENIGLYGCSTGATLSAGSVAWFQKEKLPRPGAIGLFGDGATKDDHVDGDSWFINWPLSGHKVLAPDQSYQVLYPEAYMKGTDYNDPLVAPVVSPKVLSQFPPTLVISSTRDVGLSEAVYTHTQLIKAGVQADLHVWEGLWHCSYMDVDVPESKEMYDVTTKFFDKNLGNK